MVATEILSARARAFGNVTVGGLEMIGNDLRFSIKSDSWSDSSGIGI